MYSSVILCLRWYVLTFKTNRGNRTNATHLEAFVTTVRECGIIFNVWEKREADRKPTGKYEWTSLMGKDNKLLAALPSKLHLVLPADIMDTIVQLWRVSKVAKYILSIHGHV